MTYLVAYESKIHAGMLPVVYRSAHAAENAAKELRERGCYDRVIVVLADESTITRIRR